MLPASSARPNPAVSASGRGGVGGEQVVGARGGDRGEDGEAERGAELQEVLSSPAARPAWSAGTPALAAVVTPTNTAPSPIDMTARPGSRSVR